MRGRRWGGWTTRNEDIRGEEMRFRAKCFSLSRWFPTLWQSIKECLIRTHPGLPKSFWWKDNPGDVRLMQEAFSRGCRAHRLNVVTSGRRPMRYLRRENEYNAGAAAGPGFLTSICRTCTASVWRRSRATLLRRTPAGRFSSSFARARGGRRRLPISMPIPTSPSRSSFCDFHPRVVKGSRILAHRGQAAQSL